MDLDGYRTLERAALEALDLVPDERWLELPTGRTRVLEIGRGEPVLFLHGGGGSMVEFLPLLAHLRDIRAIVPERPGCGLTDPFDYADVRDLAAHAAAFVDSVASALDLHAVPVVGNSMGGAFALWYAQAHPSRLPAMVQLGCPALVLSTSAPLPLRMMSTRPMARLIEHRPLDAKMLARIYKTMGHPAPAWSPGQAALAVAAANLPGAARGFTSQLRAAVRLRGARLSIAEATLRAVGAPTLLVWGARDPFGDRTVAERVAATVPDATLELVPDAGHLPWMDAPETCATHIRRFLAEHRARSARA